jgi:spermidine synthase
MEHWFSEFWTNNIKFSVKVKDHFFSKKTKFQQLDFYDSYELGRFFTLDQVMMANEKDEFIYHEMMIHTPMSVNPNIKKVLVIGGGDGGSVRELTRYKSIERIDMVEIDEDVVRACQEYFPITASKLTDPRVHLYFEDGLAFVRNSKEIYDLIVVDSTDPIGPGEGLFTKEFYQNCYLRLSDAGILVNQHESPYFENTKIEMKRAHDKIKALFPIARVYQAFIPTYPSGHWLFGFASKEYDPITHMNPNNFNSKKLVTKYYNTEIHKASFVLPNYVADALKSS